CRRWRRRHQLIDDRAHRIAGTERLAATEQRCGCSRAPDQALRIRQHERIVPRALNDKRQFELVGARSRDQPRYAFESEVAGRPGGLPADGEADRRAEHAHFVDEDQALIDFEIDGELIEWRAAAAEVAAARERAALQPAQQLFDIDAGQGAGAGIERRGAIESMGNGQDRIPGAIDIHRQGAAAFDPVQPEYLTETIIQIDVGELHVRGDRDAAFSAGEAQRAFGDAAESLRLADGDVELALAHRRRDRGTAQSRGRNLDIGGGEPQIETEVAETVERDR